MVREFLQDKELNKLRVHILAQQIAKQHVLIEFLEHSLSGAKRQMKEWQEEQSKIHNSLSETKMEGGE